jgi:hypothetical protein
MATIDQIIKQSLNPFDNFAAGNFWEDRKLASTVESIHQEALTQIKSVLDNVALDRQTRTLILYGDTGAGKTYFLSRLKQRLNDRAFFVYIEPFPHSDYIWRHILRYTIDSMVNSPEGQKDSQLILWLKSFLSTIQEGLQNEQQSLINKIKSIFGQAQINTKSDRQLFIDILKKTIGIPGVLNANEFFGVLYDLTNPDLYPLACEWLKGDDLDEESLKKLQVKQSIDNEDKARGILGNFSKISAKTQPIVLCFDQLDNIARLPEGSIDIQALFNVNSAIYNGNWKGFLIIISIRTNTWNNNYRRINPADLDRISLKVALKRIDLSEAEALLANRLHPLHRQANPQPNSAIYPLNQQVLLKEFPSNKTSPRNVLLLGKRLFESYKERLVRDRQPPKPSWLDDGNIITLTPTPNKLQAEFQLLWQHEYKKVHGKITKITLLAAPELIRMLQEALSALQMQGITPKLLTGAFSSYSFSYRQSNQQKKVGIVWTEDANMRSFFNTMNACQRAIDQNVCQSLVLVRATGLGNERLVGNQIYRQIFTQTSHRHIKPNLSSVHTLVTYHNLVNSSLANELVVSGKIVSLKELETLVRDLKILQECSLLQELLGGGITPPPPPPLNEAKKFLLNLITTQQILGRKTLIQNVISNFPELDESKLNQLLEKLCQEKKIQFLGSGVRPEAQLVCLVPKK